MCVCAKGGGDTSVTLQCDIVLRWWDTVGARVLTVYLRTLVTILLETAAIRGVFFQPKIEFSSYVYETF